MHALNAVYVHASMEQTGFGNTLWNLPQFLITPLSTAIAKQHSVYRGENRETEFITTHVSTFIQIASAISFFAFAYFSRFYCYACALTLTANLFSPRHLYAYRKERRLGYESNIFTRITKRIYMQIFRINKLFFNQHYSLTIDLSGDYTQAAHRAIQELLQQEPKSADSPKAFAGYKNAFDKLQHLCPRMDYASIDTVVSSLDDNSSYSLNSEDDEAPILFQPLLENSIGTPTAILSTQIATLRITLRDETRNVPLTDPIIWSTGTTVDISTVLELLTERNGFALLPDYPQINPIAMRLQELLKALENKINILNRQNREMLND